MDAKIRQALLDLNQAFYQDFATSFSQTRRRLQPGVVRVLAGLDPAANLLDLGCGNGELWRWLAGRGHHGRYTGLDFSPGLLEDAHQANPTPTQAQFLLCDLSSPGWQTGLNPPYDVVFAFAALHHIPGVARRLALVQDAAGLLAPGGRFIHSHWQFLNSPRWQARVQPWDRAGLDPQAVEPGDYLLDWRSGGTGLRYVHMFSEAELAEMAQQAGFSVEETFSSDGKEGNLALYQTWRKLPGPG